MRQARLERGWTQQNLADAVGAHSQTIGNLERASHETQPELLTKLEEVLDVDLSPVGMAGQAAIDAVVVALADRMRNMTPGQGLIFGADVLEYVEDYRPRERRRKHA